MRELEKLETEINWLTTEIAERERELRVGEEAAEKLPKLRKKLQSVGLEYAQAVTEEYGVRLQKEAV